jgi:hypothetical protein
MYEGLAVTGRLRLVRRTDNGVPTHLLRPDTMREVLEEHHYRLITGGLGA